MTHRLSEVLIPLSLIIGIFGMVIARWFDIFETVGMFSSGLAFVSYLIGVVAWIWETFRGSSIQMTTFSKILRLVSFLLLSFWFGLWYASTGMVAI